MQGTQVMRDLGNRLMGLEAPLADILAAIQRVKDPSTIAAIGVASSGNGHLILGPTGVGSDQRLASKVRQQLKEDGPVHYKYISAFGLDCTRETPMVVQNFA